jgi:hypothetical protein
LGNKKPKEFLQSASSNLTIKTHSERLGSDYEQNDSKVKKKTNPFKDWFN